mmetsp:Transcript_23899/g.50687  ORF Transcript_23899/g.50687 Transcript_23899/m.50687 type:complete len:356 (+) Transcript_23899:240-1307(+)
MREQEAGTHQHLERGRGQLRGGLRMQRPHRSQPLPQADFVRREEDLMRPYRRVLLREVDEQSAHLRGAQQLRAGRLLLPCGELRAPRADRPHVRRVDRAVDHDVRDVHAEGLVLLRHHLHEAALRRLGRRGSPHVDRAAERHRVARHEHAALPPLAHRREHLLRAEQQPLHVHLPRHVALAGVDHLDGVRAHPRRRRGGGGGRRVAGVVAEHVHLAHLLPHLRERLLDRLLRRAVALDRDAVPLQLRVDVLLDRPQVVERARHDHDGVALLRELDRQRAAQPPQRVLGNSGGVHSAGRVLAAGADDDAHLGLGGGGGDVGVRPREGAAGEGAAEGERAAEVGRRDGAAGLCDRCE